MSIMMSGVSYTYASTKEKALDNVSLSIEEGSFVGIMGETGCGKSTLLQLLAGLLEPDGVRAGLEIPPKITTGIIFQYPEHQIFETTVERETAFGLKYSGLSKIEIQKRVQEALEQVGFDFEKIRNQSPLSMSGGEKRRIAIAGVLVLSPSLLLLDEPVAGLDPMGRVKFLTLIEKLHQEGVTIIMVSHDADILSEYAERILVMQKGKIVLDGTPNEVFADEKRAEELHIGVSEVRKICNLLEKNGIQVNSEVGTYQELLELIREWKGANS